MSIFDLIRENKLDDIKALLETDPEEANARNDYGWTPLHLAAWFGYKAVCELLKKHGGVR